MHTKIIEGNWQELKGHVREQWGKLTDDDLDVIAGQRDQLIGKIKERYGKTVDDIQREVDDFERRHSEPSDRSHSRM